MAIKKDITFEGLKYNLDNRDRVAAYSALNGVSGSDFDFQSIGGTDSGVTGSLFITASHELTGSTVPGHGYAVLCVSGVEQEKV